MSLKSLAAENEQLKAENKDLKSQLTATHTVAQSVIVFMQANMKLLASVQQELHLHRSEESERNEREETGAEPESQESKEESEGKEREDKAAQQQQEPPQKRKTVAKAKPKASNKRTATALLAIKDGAVHEGATEDVRTPRIVSKKPKQPDGRPIGGSAKSKVIKGKQDPPNPNNREGDLDLLAWLA